MDRLRLLAAWCLPAALAAVLLWYGGAGAQSRALALTLLGAGLLLAAICARRAAHPPPIAWWACLFTIPLLQPLLQAMPLGFGHPWAAADRAALGVAPTAWALDASASWRAAAWAVAAAAAALLASWAWRGDRLVRLAMAVTALAAVHAAVAPFLAIVVPDWPSPHGAGRVRGTFVYPNHAAAFWAAILPMALCLARSDAAHRRAWLAASAALAAALLLSASRGGILVALVCCLPLAWSLLPRRGRWWWAGLGAAVISVWLWAADLRQTVQRFGQLGDEYASASGLTMNGRLLLWRSALPAVPDGGAWGLGAGGARDAYLRGGEHRFGDAMLLNLHNDPLEWLVERGWAGTALALLGAIAAGWLVLRRARERDGDARATAVALGASVGLLHLALHSCGEFVWQREAIVLLACCWLAVAAGAGRAEPAARSTRPWRLGLAAAGLLALLAAWVERPLAAEASLAWQARRDAAARQRQGLDPLSAARVREALAAEPRSADLAVLQAELVLALPGADPDPPARAARALAAAGALAPAHPLAWIQRLQLAVRQGDAATTATAVARVEARASGRPEARWSLLAAALAGGTLSEARCRELMLAMLAGAQAPPPAFFPAAARLLGDEALSIALVEAPAAAVRRAGEPWLRQHGSLAAWLAVRAATAPEPPWCAPAQLAVATQAWARTPRLRLPADGEGLRAQAEQLRSLALPLPPAVAEALRAQGGAYPALAARPHWPDGDAAGFLAATAAIGGPLAAWLQVPWARQAWEESRLAAAIANGRDEPGVTAPPALLQAAWLLPADPAVHDRLTVALAAIDRGWEELPGGLGHARWWRGDLPAPWVQSDAWVGLLIDGAWMGWRRGTWQIPDAGPGLHRLVVMPPP